VKYEPFDPNNIDKYVVGDDYLPIWNVPSLKKYYVHQKASMKVAVESHLKTLGDYEVDGYICIELYNN
jgi:tubulin monoglycylase TTLL15